MTHPARPGPIVVRRLRPGEEDAAVDVLTTAFERIPLSHWLQPDDTERRSEHRSHFREALRDAADSGIVEVTDDLAAVAVWEAPRADPRRPAQPPSPGTPPKMRPADRLFAAITAATPTGTRWTLTYLGAQVPGGGRGPTLVRHRLEQLPDASMRLWTSQESSVAFYHHLGFDVASHHEVPGASAWWLTRDPM